ncbi:MAG: type II toxin-antitoxin system HicA family toxin [Candidatus Gracilibacteria bacterium]|nr:type II toxin-antitoxin system HicA family toxin [Candidatus Gracilibacteria bacterium]
MVKSDYNYISGEDLIKKLNKYYDLNIITQKGSHIKISVGGVKSIVPNHKELAYGTFSAIMKQLQIAENIFLKLK